MAIKAAKPPIIIPAMPIPFGERVSFARVTAMDPNTIANAPITIAPIPKHGIIENKKAKIPDTKPAIANPCPLF
jgi:hypothetical protein